MELTNFCAQLSSARSLSEKKDALTKFIREFGFRDFVFSQIVPKTGTTRFSHHFIVNDDMRAQTSSAADDYDLDELYWRDVLLQAPLLWRRPVRWPLESTPAYFHDERLAKLDTIRMQAGLKMGICDIRLIPYGYQLLCVWSYKSLNEVGKESLDHLSRLIPLALNLFGDAVAEDMPKVERPQLKPKEYQVLIMHVNGKSKEEIADYTGTTVRQVRRTIETVRKRFGARSNEELVAWLISTGLLPPLMIGPKQMVV